jgi:hypothetical protein
MLFTVIYSYRLEHLLDIYSLKNNMRSINLVSKKIICAIDIQRQAMKWVSLPDCNMYICNKFNSYFYSLSIFLVNKLETMMYSLIIVGLICLSLNLFQVSYRFFIKCNNIINPLLKESLLNTHV